MIEISIEEYRMAHDQGEILPPFEEELAQLYAEPKALISVSDKDGVTQFAGGLCELGYGIVSTGGTAIELRKANIEVTDVAELTGYPEMLGGRVKTLHPIVHGGILANITDQSHVQTLLEKHIPFFGIVDVNLYPFEETLAKEAVTAAQINENIDIGGPAMLRAAAKARRVVVSSAAQRMPILDWLQDGRPDEEAFLDELAAQAFYETARYDLGIARYLGGSSVSGSIARPVKYGENGYQKPAALYADNRVNVDPLGIDQFEFLDSLDDDKEKFEKGYVGVTDLDRLLQTGTHIVAGFERNFGEVPFIAIAVKHGNACGAAALGNTLGESVDALIASDELNEATKKAIDGDTRAVHGGSVLINGVIDEKIATTLMHYATGDEKKRLIDGIYAAGFTDEARVILSRSKLRLAQNPALGHLSENSLDKAPIIRPVRGGQLEQPNFSFVQDFNHEKMEFLGEELTDQEKRDMILAWAVGSTSNSNTVTLVKDGHLIGNGVGQLDRVGAGQLALSRTTTEVPTLEHSADKLIMTIELNRSKIEGAVAYSDSFFPFVDGPQLLVDAGVKAIMTSFISEHHKDLLLELVQRGTKFALMPDPLSRGFFNH
jgi:phosphoribosylaminoimidazolecarboxamide formyltransferase/IMP cyclohydrolase